MPRLASPKVILYFIVLAVLDATVMPVLQIHSAYPSLLCLFVCYSAFKWGSNKTVYVAFWAGITRDLLGTGPVGLDASILVGLALALDFLVQKTERELPGIHFIMTFLFVFCAGLFRLLAGYSSELPLPLMGEYLGLVTMGALYTGALLPGFNYVTDRWFGHSSVKQFELFR